VKDDLANYNLWHPRLVTDRELTLTLTPGESSAVPDSDPQFFKDILSALKITADVKDSQIIPYRCSYHADPDTQEWGDRWPVNWRLNIALSVPVRLPKLKHESIGLVTTPEGVWDQDDDSERALPCFVFADFRSASAADKTRAQLQHSKEMRNLRSPLNLPALQFERQALARSLVQDQIGLGVVPVRALAEGFEYGFAVERICSEQGGITNFEQRIGKWDEVYHEAGID
jgi:hypothetical protein